MHNILACQLLAVPPSADKAQIKAAYLQKINLAEDAIDDAVDIAAENAAWQHYQQLQQARSLLLKVLSNPADEASEPAPSPVKEKSAPLALPLTVEAAYALLGLVTSASQEQIQQAYQLQLQQVDSAIDQIDSQGEAEPLWEQHKTIQQARYLLLHARVPVPQGEQSHSNKVLHACAELGVNADSPEQVVRNSYNQKIRSIEDQIDAASSPQQEDQLWDRQRQLQRAFAIFTRAAASPVMVEQAPSIRSPHQGRVDDKSASLDDFLKQQKRQKLYQIVFRILLLVLLLLGGCVAWQKGYLQQAKDWLLPPQADVQESHVPLKPTLVTKVKRRIPVTPEKAQIKLTVEPAVGLPKLNASQRLLMPVLIDVPAGEFIMGDATIDDAQPVHKVSLAAFKLGESEVSVKHFRQFVQQTKYQTEAERDIDEKGCSTFSEDSKSWAWRSGSSWKNPGFEQGEEDPVACLSWADVQAYLNWLRGATAWNVRLASEAEWEYAARAGTNTTWFWGDKLSLERANCEDCNQDWEIRQTFASRAYTANAFGLHSMPGNVWEWLQDCWQGGYVGAPDNGQPRLDGNCAKRVMRGGSWYSPARDLRSAARNASSRLTYRSSTLGFRIALSHSLD